MTFHRILRTAAVVVITVSGLAACSGNGETAVPSQDSAPNDSTTEPVASGDQSFFAMIDENGDEVIEVDHLQCLRDPQPVVDGPGTMTVTVSAQGTNATGQPVILGFTRFGDDTDKPRDHVSVTVGSTPDDKVNFYQDASAGTVNVEDDKVWAAGLPLMDASNPGGGIGLNFELYC